MYTDLSSIAGSKKTASVNIAPRFLQFIRHAWTDMDSFCAFIYASLPLCMDGGICKFLANSSLCSDVLQPISLVPFSYSYAQNECDTRILRPA